MESDPVANSKQMVNSSTRCRNLPARLDIHFNSLTPTSSPPPTPPLLATTPQPPFGDLLNDGCISGPNGEEIDPTKLKELSRLGEGVSGIVIKVKDTSTGLLMARKKIKVSDKPKRILRELQFLRTCRSPNIVSYYGAILEDNNTSIAIFMEYCEGGSLYQIYKDVGRREGRIGEVILGKIGESVLKGLVYLYSQRIIHRDIKPSNILVTKKGEIKICDFGVSGDLVGSIADTFLGTSYYMSPERLVGQPYKVSADVWSLGITIMEVAQNRFPYPSILTPIELVMHICDFPAPTLSKEYGWSKEFEDFLKICLEKDGAKRPSPKQMLDHPFIQLSSQRRINSGLWVKQVWEWE